MHLTQYLHRALQQDPQRLATVFGDRTRTVAESAGRVARFAGALQALGVGPGIGSASWRSTAIATTSSCSRCRGRARW
jgi:non-ribosomal peptide synthetase component E (peptide arylation enzyme)